MEPATFLAECRRRGLTLTAAAGGELRVRGPASERRRPGVMAYLRRHKAELVGLLSPAGRGSDMEQPRAFPFTYAESFLRLAPDHCVTPTGTHLYRWPRDRRWHYRRPP